MQPITPKTPPKTIAQTPQQITPTKRRRGRPRKTPAAHSATRAALLRSGIELLTEKGYSATGLEEILRSAGVPKGSFYHYFASKEQFTQALIDHYADFFRHLLDKHLACETLSPLERLNAFIQAASAGMARYQFKRGCLVGNLGQEMNALPAPFRAQIQGVLLDWQQQLALCLTQAQQAGEISRAVPVEEQAYLFWIGWEGAVLRAKLDQSATPLRLFGQHFISALKQHTPLS